MGLRKLSDADCTKLENAAAHARQSYALAFEAGVKRGDLLKIAHALSVIVKAGEYNAPGRDAGGVYVSPDVLAAHPDLADACASAGIQPK